MQIHSPELQRSSDSLPRSSVLQVADDGEVNQVASNKDIVRYPQIIKEVRHKVGRQEPENKPTDA